MFKRLVAALGGESKKVVGVDERGNGWAEPWKVACRPAQRLGPAQCSIWPAVAGAPWTSVAVTYRRTCIPRGGLGAPKALDRVR